MSNTTRQSLSHGENNDTTDENHWKQLKVNFSQEACQFPNNKIYATIQIDPETDRQLIDYFTLIVNGYNRGEIAADYKHISITGFDIGRNSGVRIRIRANPINRKLKTIRKESNTCIFSFTKQFLSLSPLIKFDWTSENTEAVAVIQWHVLYDPSIQTYDITIDGDVIKHVKQDTSKKEIKTLIYNFTPGKKYSLQMFAKLKNDRVKYKSDLIEFTVPFEEETEEEEGSGGEVLHVQREKIPEAIRNFVIVKRNETQLKENALDLLDKLRRQIVRRRIIIEKTFISNHSTI